MKTPATPPAANLRLRRDVLTGLEHLRSETRDISRMYVANLQRDMVQLIDFVNAAGTVTSQRRRQISFALARMKETLDLINTKPEKGRLKDLRRIEQAIRTMMKLAFTKNADA